MRVSGTANRITWRTKGRDGTALMVISEPKKGGTASLVVQIIGTATLDDTCRPRGLDRDHRPLRRDALG